MNSFQRCLAPVGAGSRRLIRLSSRIIPGVTAVVAVFASALALSATPAFAYSPRTYESQLNFPTELTYPGNIAIGSFNHVWFNENLSSLLYEFNVENEKLTQVPGTIGNVFFHSNIAADHTNHDLYEVGDQGGAGVARNAAGEVLKSFPVGGGSTRVAVDNSESSTAGRIFISYGLNGEGTGAKDVELLSENGLPITFPRYLEPTPPPYINGNLLTGTPSGPFVNPGNLTVGTSGDIYVVDSGHVYEFKSSGEFFREFSAGSSGVPTEFNPSYLAVDPTNGDLLATSEKVVDEFSSSGAYLGQVTSAGVVGRFAPGAIAVNSDGFLYVLNTLENPNQAGAGLINIFSPSIILPKVSYPGVSDGTQTSVTLNAEVDPRGGGQVETCKFEYVSDAGYDPAAANPFAAGHTTSCSQPLPYSGSAPTQVSAEIPSISPGVTYHYRLLAGNQSGTTEALPRTFDLRAPTVSGVSASNLAETTADLNANINPEGGDTTYRFEYGTTVGYGSSAPVSAADIGSFDAQQPVSVHLTNLEKGGVYHFRLVVENPFGVVVTEDQTFNFFPPGCPNAILRQESGTAFLPDCRAYELVSPGNAGGTILFPEGPQSPYATQPSRFAFGGILGEIPEAGGEPPDVRGDLYVATRSDSGWSSRYIGPSATQTLIADGPPNEEGYIQDVPSGALTDLEMNQFMDWYDNYNGIAGSGRGSPGSYAPYLWSPEGHSLGRLPTNLGVVPGGEEVGERLVGAVKPSPEFNHYFFSSTSALSFAPESLSHEPGSAYDDNLEKNTVELISKLPSGEPIEEGGGEYITFPGVSTDGSHVLMSTGFTGGGNPNYDFAVSHRVNAERHLFMRVGGGQGITYPIAPGHAVHYVGMNADGSKVYFTSSSKLTTEAEDTSANLYMWSEQGQLEGKPLTLVSKPDGSGGTGTPVCPPTTWTEECGVVPLLNATSKELPDSILHGGPGGNGLSDNAIAATNADIYFFSPQQLDGTSGVFGQRNLYDYRYGKVQYVTTFNTGNFCVLSACSEGPLIRIQVSANDTHMAFLTASQITSYNNAGHLEMYAYDPTTGAIHCVSCLPDGSPPTSDVEASDNGLFMTEDGRVFFSTADSLVPQDTDGIRDVYEYVGGRPQLISAGTGSREIGVAITKPPGLDRAGLSSVSANGTDVYFSTFDTLVPSDHNGNALKFYDARTNGGFGELPAAAPCAAAEECVGPGSSPPAGIQNGSGADLGTLGNVDQTSNAQHKRNHQHKRTHEKRHHPRKRHLRRATADRGADR